MSTRGPAEPPRAPRVLVVDDEPQIVRALKVVLREAGFEAIAAETAEQALGRVMESPMQPVGSVA